MLRRTLSILALFVLLVASAGRSTAFAASGRLDQSYTATPDLYVPIDSSNSYAQTYTAGASGKLNHVVLYLTSVGSMTAPLQVQIFSTLSGFPSGSALGSATITPSSLPNWNNGGGCTPVSVSISAPQVAGSRYAIALSSSSQPALGWCGTSANGYAGGQPYVSSPPGSVWTPSSAGDLDFSTYVRSHHHK